MPDPQGPASEDTTTDADSSAGQATDAGGSGDGDAAATSTPASDVVGMPTPRNAPAGGDEAAETSVSETARTRAGLIGLARRGSDAAGDIVDDADAPSEDASDRDGAFSWMGETHSFAMGLAAGYAAGAHGDIRILGAVVAAALYGARGGSALDPAITRQIRMEAPYAAGGAVLGALFAQLTTGNTVTAEMLREVLRAVFGA